MGLCPWTFFGPLLPFSLNGSPILVVNSSACFFQGLDRITVSHKLDRWRPQRPKTMTGLLEMIPIYPTDELLTWEHLVRFMRFGSAFSTTDCSSEMRKRVKCTGSVTQADGLSRPLLESLSAGIQRLKRRTNCEQWQNYAREELIKTLFVQ